LLCGRKLTKRGMARHLRACRNERRGAAAGRKGRSVPTICLAVDGSPLHWLHLESVANATLGDLDALLRRTWLECCGHLSDFLIDGVRYAQHRGEYREFGEFGEPDTGRMTARLDSVLRAGVFFTHTYDYGSTTTCRLRVTGTDEAHASKERIRIQARNDPPEVPCDSCGKPAVQICSECIWDEKGVLCGRCARGHECGEEMLLAVVNSPRAGVCGYMG